MRQTTARVGSVVPCENVDPHTGPYLDYGVIVGWVNQDGEPCPRKQSVAALVEVTGRKAAEWSDWAEEHAWKLDPFLEGQQG